MLQVTGGQVIAVLFTCLFTIFGIVFYYFYERRINKMICKTKKQKLTQKNMIATTDQNATKNLKAKLKKKPRQILVNPHILTTEEAAHLLNISRPHLVQLLEEGKMPCRKIGTTRRIKLQDILTFKKSTAKNWSKINELDILFSYVSLRFLC
jgi:excisionase family DNA binding protein